MVWLHEALWRVPCHHQPTNVDYIDLNKIMSDLYALRATLERDLCTRSLMFSDLSESSSVWSRFEQLQLHISFAGTHYKGNVWTIIFWYNRRILIQLVRTVNYKFKIFGWIRGFTPSIKSDAKDVLQRNSFLMEFSSWLLQDQNL